MSDRIVTINLSTFTFEQLEEAYSRLACIPGVSPLSDALCQDLHDELEAHVQLRNSIA
jgi:hypothetical protein